MEEWRLIITPPQNGPLNMAIDEALLLSTVKNCSAPILRLFAWDPGCLSLGFAQPFTDVDEKGLSRHAWDIVRRPTGGRAILHIDELTYSISAPLDNPAVNGSLLESYRHLSGGLIKTLEILGVRANADKEYANSDLRPDHPVCFEVPSNYEITANGKKLVGSAQSRKMGGLLQHGTLPLYGDIARIADVLNFPDEASRQDAKIRIYSHATTLGDVLHREITWTETASAMITGFEAALGISLSESKLTDEENELAVHLLDSKYSTNEWNHK